MSARSFWRPGKGQSRAAVYSFLGLVSWFPVIASFNLYVAEVTRINGKSMYPFMNADRDSILRRDVCLNWKWGANRDLERGMVVTLRSPTQPENIAVKRVVALEGDVIRTKAPYPVATVMVPAEHVWVEGDGPPGTSLDSNTYGPVSKQLITGRITHVLYPFNKFGPLEWRDHKRPLVY